MQLKLPITGQDKTQGFAPCFDPFFTTKKLETGTGMGLAICYKLMEECGGNIDIISENGNGTTVVWKYLGEKDVGDEKV